MSRYRSLWALLILNALVGGGSALLGGPLYSWTNINVPFATGHTYAEGINNLGNIAGYYTDQHGNEYGYFDIGGVYSTFDPIPGNTFIQAINNNGVAVGHTDGTGFIATPGNAYTYTTLNVPGANYTSPNAINDNGEIAGYYLTGGPPFPTYHGFIYNAGIFTTFDYPGAIETELLGINNSGQITGYAYDNSRSYAFIYQGGSYQTLTPPPTWGETTLVAINNSGVTAGTYLPNGIAPAHAALYGNGVFTDVNSPDGAVCSLVSGINDQGQFLMTDANGNSYLGTRVDVSPEPSALYLFLSAATAGLWLRSRTRAAHPTR